MITIVTGTRDRPESFRRFLQSVCDCATVPTRVIVQDAGKSVSETMRVIHAVTMNNQSPVTVDLNSEDIPLGTTKGYNIAFRKCKTPYVVWLNDDCVLLPGWDTTAVAYMEQYPEVGCGIIYWKDRPNGEWQKRFGIQHLFGIAYANFGFIRREIGEACGWFDESIGRKYCCDTDLSFSVIWNGHAVAPIPDCKLLHYREMDDHRANDNVNRSSERANFDRKWLPRQKELQEKQRAFLHLQRPTWMD